MEYLAGGGEKRVVTYLDVELEVEKSCRPRAAKPEKVFPADVTG